MVNFKRFDTVLVSETERGEGPVEVLDMNFEIFTPDAIDLGEVFRKAGAFALAKTHVELSNNDVVLLASHPNN